jgi:signal transduction histidine kinase
MSQFASGQMDLKAWRLFAEEAIPRSVSEVPEALKVVQERRPVLIPDVADSSMWPWIEPFEVGSVLLVPLVIQDRVIGIMALDNVETGQTFTAAQVNLAMTIGAQAATALENSRLFQAERRQRELTEALEEAAAVVSSTLELDRVLDRILEQVERVVAGDAFNVMLVEGDMARIARWRGYEPSEASGSVAAVSTPIASCPHLQRMVGGDSVVVPDVTADPNWGGEEAPRRWRSYVGAPIVVTGLTVGFLNVIGTDLAQFGPEDAQRLEIFARHAATAIENAQLYQEVRNHVDQLEERVQERTAQIQAQYARLEAILSSTGDGVIVTDDEGGILQVNRVAETWLTQTLPADEVKQLRETTRDLVARVGERPEAVLELESIDLQITAAPIREPAGEGRAVVALHDVSHLKELERLKSRFVSNVSHELRTPITTIVLYAKLIRNHPESLEEYIDPLVREAEREAELVENILQISRLDAGRLEFDPQPAGLNRLVAESIDSLQMLAKNKGITLVDQFAQPEPVAWADPERLQQVLNNLLENAIHYTPEGGHVAVSTGKRVTEGASWVTVTIEDTGIGIPEDERPHIFERFYRGERPRREQISGSGLGLAIVQEIVELHGGRVTVESEVGSGSTFTVWLPPSE